MDRGRRKVRAPASRPWRAGGAFAGLALLLAGCGRAPPEPTLLYLGAHARPGPEGRVARIDWAAELWNPTRDLLRGVHLVVRLPGREPVTLELGDVAPGGVARTWQSRRVDPAARATDQLGGEPEKLAGEGPIPLLAARVAKEVRLGYRRGGELVRQYLSPAVAAAWPGWVEEDRVAAEGFEPGRIALREELYQELEAEDAAVPGGP